MIGGAKIYNTISTSTSVHPYPMVRDRKSFAFHSFRWTSIAKSFFLFTSRPVYKFILFRRPEGLLRQNRTKTLAGVPITKSTPSWNKFEHLLAGIKATYSCI